MFVQVSQSYLILKKKLNQYIIIDRVNKSVAIWEALARQEFSEPEMVFRVQVS